MSRPTSASPSPVAPVQHGDVYASSSPPPAQPPPMPPLDVMRTLQTDRLRLRLAEEQRVLVSAKDVNETLINLGMEIVAQLQAVESDMGSFLDQEGRKELRKRHTHALERIRERLEKSRIRSGDEVDIETELKQFDSPELKLLTASAKQVKSKRGPYKRKRKA